MSNIAMDQSNLVRWFVQMLIPYEYPHSPKIGYSHEKCLWINKNDASAPYRSPSWEILHGFTIAPKKPSDLRRAPHLQGHQQLNFTWFWWIWLDFSELFWILWIFSGYLWMFVAFKWKLSIPIFLWIFELPWWYYKNCAICESTKSTNFGEVSGYWLVSRPWFFTAIFFQD